MKSKKWSQDGKKMLFFSLAVVFLLTFSLFARESQATQQAVQSVQDLQNNVPHEYMVLFHPVSSVVECNKPEVREKMVETMLQMQTEYLKNKYQVEVLSEYKAISVSTGQGMFHIKVVFGNSSSENKLIESMRQDDFIVSVEENRLVKIS